MDATKLLTQDHQEAEDLFRKFEAVSDRALVNVTARQELADKIIERLTIHAELAEEIFYPAVRPQVGAAKDAVLKAVEEHHVAEIMMEEIKGLAAGDETFGAKVAVLIGNVRHHRETEEQEIFPLVRKAFAAEQLETLGQRLERARQRKQGGAAREKPGAEFFSRGPVGTAASLVARVGRLTGGTVLGRLGGVGQHLRVGPEADAQGVHDLVR